jgi:small subunit ribosomal protein S6
MAEPLPKHRAREYETIFIVTPEATSEKIDQIANRVTETIDKLDGKLLKAENWGKKRLAYPVKKQKQGFYIYLKFLGYSDMVFELERNLRMMEPVIKHLTIKIEEDVNPESKIVTESDISFIPRVEEEPEEQSDTIDEKSKEDDLDSSDEEDDDLEDDDNGDDEENNDDNTDSESEDNEE